MKLKLAALAIVLSAAPGTAARYLEYNFSYGSHHMAIQIDTLNFDGTLPPIGGCPVYMNFDSSSFSYADTGCWVGFYANATFDPIDLSPSSFTVHVQPLTSNFDDQYIIDARYEIVGHVTGPLTNLVIRGSDNPFAEQPPLSAPEPSSWAMMIGGFGGIGGLLRRRRNTVVAFG